VSDVGRLHRLALDKHEPGARRHAVAEEGIPVREIAEVIGAGLGVPVRSLSADEAAEHLSWLGALAGMALPASGAFTRDRLGWEPADLDLSRIYATWVAAWPKPEVRLIRLFFGNETVRLQPLIEKEFLMPRQAHSALPREAKGSLAPAPALDGPFQEVADAVAAWPEVAATTHWHLRDRDRVDGIDFYVGPNELGHIHLDGSIHLATTPELGAKLVAEGLGRPFPWARGWTMASVSSLGVESAVALFRRNYDRLRPAIT
jgi:hypothetical protein